MSKRFSLSGIHIPRHGGACPRWNVHAAFLTPGSIRVQLSQYPNGSNYVSLARTLRKETTESILDGVLIVEGYNATKVKERAAKIEDIVSISPADLSPLPNQIYEFSYMLRS